MTSVISQKSIKMLPKKIPTKKTRQQTNEKIKTIPNHFSIISNVIIITLQIAGKKNFA
jgi:hypothetical protein